MIRLHSLIRPASLLFAAPVATALLLTLPNLRSRCAPLTTFTAVSSLPRLLDAKGKELSPDRITERLAGKRVAYVFSAGWCPMCTSFEPSLMQFRQAAKESGKEVELIYVPSDQSADAASKRSAALDMLQVPFGDEADQLKRDYNIWAGSEASKFGFGRRSGVPAIVVLDSAGDELKFLPAEKEGVKALSSWPLDDDKGLW